MPSGPLRPSRRAATTSLRALAVALVAAGTVTLGAAGSSAVTPSAALAERAGGPVSTSGSAMPRLVASGGATASTPPAERVIEPVGEPTVEPVGERGLAGASAEVVAQEAAVAAAREQLEALSATASAALETYQDALRARDEAILAHQQQLARYDAAQAELHTSREDMARWTSQAYRQGVAAAGVAGFVAVVDAKSPDDLEQRVTVLRQVGRVEARELAGAAEAEATQADATAAAEETTRAALATAAEAESAKAASDAAVAQAREQLAALEELLAASRSSADDTAAATAAASTAAARLRSGGAAALAGCSSTDLSGFANGQVPASALCPLPGAPGQSLRSDAAAAFVELSAAYTAEFGQPLCVTDSYRDLASQVAVRAAKPGLAAVPGTSNHGWGVALDLCGGVQTFGSPQHAWMRLNAPLHGWFHPGWAQSAGTKPEPWHWEFAG